MLEQELSGTGSLTKNSHEDVEKLLDHAQKMGALIRTVLDITTEKWQEAEMVEDRDNDGIGIEDDERWMEDEQVLVIAEPTQHKIVVVQKLATDREAVADP